MASGETWSVWNNEKKKFVKSTEMVCRLLTPDELVALAPDTIMMNAEQLGHCWHEAPGAIASYRRDAAGLRNECFKKIDEMKNGRPVYQSWREKNQRPVLTADPVALFQTNSVVTCFKGSERVGSCHRFSDRYLIYQSKKKIWTVTFSAKEEDIYLQSAPTDCYSPLVAPWVDDETTRYRPTLPHELDKNGYPESQGGKKTTYRKVGLPGLRSVAFCWCSKSIKIQDAHNIACSRVTSCDFMWLHVTPAFPWKMEPLLVTDGGGGCVRRLAGSRFSAQRREHGSKGLLLQQGAWAKQFLKTFYLQYCAINFNKHILILIDFA